MSSRKIELGDTQDDFRIDAVAWKRIVEHVVHDLFQTESCELEIHLVSREESCRINEQFLQHEGPTDVITFDYSEKESPLRFHGEILICPSVAAEEAEDFDTSWQDEVGRYLVHGLLHLDGFDDQDDEGRRVMKTREDELFNRLTAEFDLSAIGGAS
jgi:probable rRNA maturation factor